MQKPIRVLLVEDSEVTRKMLQAMIRDNSRIEVEIAGALQEALEKLEQGSIDAVVLDLTLPDAVGLEAFEAVKAASHLPIVVITGTDKEEFERRCMEGGADDYLLKVGLTPRELVRSIQHSLMRIRGD